MYLRLVLTYGGDKQKLHNRGLLKQALFLFHFAVDFLLVCLNYSFYIHFLKSKIE